MNTYIPSQEELEEIIDRAVRSAIIKEVPEVIRVLTRKEWLTTDDVMKMLQCSRRHIQYLRDSRQIKFSQSGRFIRYHIDDVEAFLKPGQVDSK